MDNSGASEPFELHRAVFENQPERLEAVLAGLKRAGTCDQAVNAKDPHGNSPLHLAVLLNRTDCLEILLAHNARIKTKNSAGWSVLAEAIGCGNRAFVKRLVSRALNSDGHEQAAPSGNRRKLQQTLESVPDFELSIQWQFKTWIPLATRFMPSDNCRVSKCGTRIRVDSTLIDFQNLKWERGNVSYLFDPIGPADVAGNEPQHHPIYVLDHERRVYSPFLLNNDANDLDLEVATLMTTPLQQMEVVSGSAHVTRVVSGWFSREPKRERIADKYSSDYYSVNDIRVVTTKRFEHLTPDDVLKSKTLLREMLKSDSRSTLAADEHDYNGLNELEDDDDGDEGGGGDDDDDDEQDTANNNSNDSDSGHENCRFREPKCTWDEYMAAVPGQYANIRPRPVVQTVKSKELKLTVALSKEFPISIGVLADLLEVVAPLSRFQKLRDFIDLKLPLKSEGFPVRIEFPVFPGVTAQVTFLNFEWQAQPGAAASNNNDANANADRQSYADKFAVPSDYTLDSNTRCTWLAG